MSIRVIIVALSMFACLGGWAEDWYWNFTKSGSNYANMSFPENWTNSVGVAGTPAAGDALYFTDYVYNWENKRCPNPDLGSTRPLEYVKVSCPAAFNFQQGAFYFQAGGRGLCIDSRTCASVSHWGSENVDGEGDVPYDIAAGRTFAVQKTMGGASGTIVLRGGGVLAMGPDDGSYGANTLGGVRIESGTLGYRIPSSKVSPSFKVSFGGNATTALFSLNRGHRLVRGLDYFELEDVTTSHHGFTSSGTDGSLCTSNVYLKCVGTPGRDRAYFTGQFYSRVGLYWAPEAKTAGGGNYEFVFTKASSSTTSDMIASNGTIRVSDGGCLGALDSIVLEEGGVFAVDSTAGGGNHAMTLRLKGATSKVALEAGAVLSVNAVEPFGGGTVESGVHTSATDSWIEGAGSLYVMGSPEKGDTYTWTGAAAQTGFGLGDNWDGGEAPSTTLGSAVAKFAAGGSCATVSETTSLYGLLFEGQDFAIDVEDAGAVLYVGAGGIETAGSGSRYVLATPMLAVAAQTWNVAAGDTLVVSNRISGFSTETILKKGDGRLDLFGASDFPNELGVTNGELHVWSDKAFGSPGTPTRISAAKVTTTFHGVTVPEPFEFYDYRIGQSFLCAPGTTNILEGRINANKGNFHTGADSGVFIFRGGMNCTGNYCPGGTTIIERTAFTLTDRVYPGNTTDMHLRVPGNNFGNNNYMMVMDGAKLWTEVPEALSNVRLSLRENAYFNLCGHDQTLIVLNGYTTGKPGVCESPAPATLHLKDVPPHSYENGPTSRVCRAVFRGQVSLSKEGDQTFYLGNESTTTGALAVAKGRLVMLTPSDGMIENGIQLKSSWTGSWPNATEAAVSGTGTLEIRHSQAFGKTTDVRITGAGARIQLAAGVNQKCRILYIDGVKQRSGTWGSPDSAAKYKSASFAGTGVIDFTGDGNGATVFIR